MSVVGLLGPHNQTHSPELAAPTTH